MGIEPLFGCSFGTRIRLIHSDGSSQLITIHHY